MFILFFMCNHWVDQGNQCCLRLNFWHSRLNACLGLVRWIDIVAWFLNIEVVGSSDLQSSKLCDKKSCYSVFESVYSQGESLSEKYNGMKVISPKQSTELDHYLPLFPIFPFDFCTMMWIYPCSLFHFFTSNRL
jgi:hypothetical protein